MKTKRGISPLIATVLIIGFTIVMAALVIQWGGDLFKGVQERTGQSSEQSERCATTVFNIEVEELQYERGKLKLKIDNLNEEDIEQFSLRIYNQDEEITKQDLQGTLPKRSLKSFSIDVEEIPKKIGILIGMRDGEEIVFCPKELGPYDTNAKALECIENQDCDQGELCNNRECVVDDTPAKQECLRIENEIKKQIALANPIFPKYIAWRQELEINIPFLSTKVQGMSKVEIEGIKANGEATIVLGTKETHFIKGKPISPTPTKTNIISYISFNNADYQCPKIGPYQIKTSA